MDLDLAKNYELPYGLTDKTFHELAFSLRSAPTNKEHKEIHKKLALKILKDVFKETPQLADRLEDRVREDKYIDLLHGIASKFNEDDIEAFVIRGERYKRGSALAKRVSEKFPNLGVVISDETATKIAQRYEEVHGESINPTDAT